MDQKQFGWAPKISGNLSVYAVCGRLCRRHPAARLRPLYGQHTDEVLQKLAGYSVEEVGRLRDAKVVS